MKKWLCSGRRCICSQRTGACTRLSFNNVCFIYIPANVMKRRESGRRSCVKKRSMRPRRSVSRATLWSKVDHLSLNFSKDRAELPTIASFFALLCTTRFCGRAEITSGTFSRTVISINHRLSKVHDDRKRW